MNHNENPPGLKIKGVFHTIRIKVSSEWYHANPTASHYPNYKQDRDPDHSLTKKDDWTPEMLSSGSLAYLTG